MKYSSWAFGLALALCSCAMARGAIPNWPDAAATSINVCTSEYTPMVYCSDREPSGYSGYEIELFRKIARVLGWDDEMLSWKCIDWDPMLESLKAPGDECDIVVAGVPAEPTQMQQGVKFTRPTYTNGLKLLVANSQQSNGMWAFWDGFTWELWVASILTPLAVAIIMWACDHFYYGATRISEEDAMAVPCPEDAAKPDIDPRSLKFERYLWECVTRPMMTRNLEAFSFAGNVVALAFGFLVFISWTLYLGNTAANLTALRLDTGGIRSLRDLRGKPVGIWEGDVEELAKYKLNVKTFPWDTVADEEAMFQALLDGEIKGLVLDASLIDYKAASDCAFSAVGDPFNLYEQAIAFPAGANVTALVAQFDEALVALQQGSDIQDLIDSFITPPAGLCEELYAPAVTFHQVAGLWVLLAGTIVAAVLLLAGQVLWFRHFQPKLEGKASYRAASDKLNNVVTKLPRAVAQPRGAGVPDGEVLASKVVT